VVIPFRGRSWSRPRQIPECQPSKRMVRIDYDKLTSYSRDALFELEERLEGDVKNEYRARIQAIEEKKEKRRKRKKKKKRRS